MKHVPQRIQGIGLLFAAIALLRWPKETSQGVVEGLSLCGQVIIPALFPFFVLSALVIHLGFSQLLGRMFQGVMWPLFRLQGNCVNGLVLGILGGYPVGAQTTVTLYQQGQCTKEEAHKMLFFCNNAGPAFLLGVVGTQVFDRPLVGGLLYLAHLTACVTLGVLTRGFPSSPTTPPKNEDTNGKRVQNGGTYPPFVPAFLRSVNQSTVATGNVCGFILCFSVVISLLKRSGLLEWMGRVVAILLAPFGITQAFAQSLVAGVIELSAGVTSLPPGGSMEVGVPLAAFLLGWAGLSIHCQVLHVVGETDLSSVPYWVGKFLHGVISALYAWIFWQMLGLPEETIPMIETVAVQGISPLGEGQGRKILVTWVVFLLVREMGKQGGKLFEKKGGKISEKGVY